jgi:hypothetical protein
MHLAQLGTGKGAAIQDLGANPCDVVNVAQGISLQQHEIGALC